MKITQKLVKTVKRHTKKQWHDQTWWDFENLPEVEAINFAIYNLARGAAAAEIAIEAKRFLASGVD